MLRSFLQLAYSNSMDVLPLWKNHPLYQAGKVECIPTAWVWQFRGTDVSENSDLKNGTPCTLDELWENIEKEGLHDPLILRIGLQSHTMRLEAGNHRIQVLYNHAIENVPVTVQIQAVCGPGADEVFNSGSHNFPITEELVPFDKTDEYMKPSEVFKLFSKNTLVKNEDTPAIAVTEASWF